MSTAFNLASLTTAIYGFVEEIDGSDLSEHINTVIQLAEDRCIKDLDLEIFTTTSTGVAFVAGTPEITKPATLLVEKNVFYTKNGSVKYLFKRDLSWLRDYWPVSSAQGTPKYYAELSETQWVVAPAPDDTSLWQANMISRPVSLVTDSDGTFLSTNAGNLLLYACLLTSEQFGVADERIPVWKDTYAEALLTTRVELRSISNKAYVPLGATPQPKGN